MSWVAEAWPSATHQVNHASPGHMLHRPHAVSREPSSAPVHNMNPRHTTWVPPAAPHRHPLRDLAMTQKHPACVDAPHCAAQPYPTMTTLTFYCIESNSCCTAPAGILLKASKSPEPCSYGLPQPQRLHYSTILLSRKRQWKMREGREAWGLQRGQQKVKGRVVLRPTAQRLQFNPLGTIYLLDSPGLSLGNQDKKDFPQTTN